MLPSWLQPGSYKNSPYFATLAEQLADGVYVRRKSGRLVYANAALSELSGYTRQQLTRMRVDKLFDVPESESKEFLGISSMSFLLRGEQKLRHKSGRLLPVEVNICFLGEDLISALVRDLGKRSELPNRPHAIEDLLSLMESEIRDVVFSLSVEPGENYRYRFANLAFYQTAALVPEQVIGRRVQEVVPEPALTVLMGHIRAAIEGKRTSGWDEVSESRRGLRYGKASITPVFNSQGACTEVVGRVHDVTELKQHELLLERQKNIYAMLSQTNQAITRLHNAEELFQTICRIAVRHGHMQFAVIVLQDPQSRQLHAAAEYGLDAGYVQFATKLANAFEVGKRGVVGQVLDSGQYDLCNDYLNDPRTQPWWELARKAGIRASAAFPIREHGEVVGILGLYADTPGYFTDDMLPTLNEMAGDLSFALDNYLREAERARLALERDQVFKRVTDGFIALDRDWNLTYVNAVACRILGSDDATLLGKQLWSVLPPEIGGQLRQAFQISMVLQQPASLEKHFDPWNSWYAVNTYPSENGLTVYFRNITDRKRAEEQERVHRSEISRISQRLLEVQESERRNLARELHDEVGQCLNAINMKLREADALAAQPPLRQLLKEASSIVTELDSQIGQMSLDLHPSVLDDLGLAAAFRWCVRTRLGSDSKKVRLDIEPGLSRFSASLERTVFRVFQESLTNAVKYAEATQVNVRLVREEGDKLLLSVSDNGRGFDVAAAIQAARNGKSLGLLGMQERARFLGGEVSIQSEPGRGTTVQLVLPGQPRLPSESRDA